MFSFRAVLSDNAKLAKQILDESDIELISAETIDEAAKKAVGLVS